MLVQLQHQRFSFTNNILSVGGNTTTIPAGTTYTGGTGINVAGSTIINTAPDQTITITPAGSASVTGTYPNFIISTPIVQTYTAGNGIDINGTGVITGTANILGTGATSVTGTYPNLTINTPTVAPDQIVSITGVNSATVTGAYPNFTVNVPSGSTLPNALSGQFLYNTGTVWDTLPRNNLYFDGTNFGIGTTSPQANFHVVGAGKFDASVSTPHVFTNTLTVSGGTLGQVLTSDALGNGTFQNLPAAQTPTITSTGIAVVTPTTGNTFNVDVPQPTLTYNTTGNVLTLTQGSYSTTAALTGTGSSTINMAATGIASVSPTSGSAFTVSVASPTFTPNGPTTITGSYPNLTINSTASPSTTLVQGNNISLNQSGNTYTVNAPAYSISSNSNTLTLTNGTVVSTATVPASSSYSGTPNNISITSNSINLVSTGVAANNYGANATNAVPTFSVDNFGRLTTAAQYTPNVAGDVIGSINTSTVSKLRGVNISTVAPTANQVLQFNAGSWAPSSIASPTITGTGVATVNNVSPNYTVNVPMSIYNNNTGVFTTGTQTIAVTPTLSLTGTTLTSGPATNSVNLATLPGLWTAPTATSVVTTNSISLVGIGTNNPTYKLDVYGTGSVPATIHGYNSGATVSSTGVFGENPNNGIGVYGQSGSGAGVWGKSTTGAGIYGESTNGDGGKFILSSNTTTANAVNAQTNGSGVALFAKSYNATALAAKFEGNTEILHSATTANPTMHLRETSGALSRIKFSNTGVANKYFEVGASNNAANNFSAYSVSFFDGTNYKSRFLIYGDGKTSINNMHAPLTTFHVMDDNATSPGIAAEGFGFSGQINLTRNNPLGVSPTYTRGAVIAAQEIGKINFSAYDGTGYGDGAKIYARASENVTNTSKGTDLFFAVVPNTTNSNQELLKLGNDGIVTVNPNNIFNKAALDVKGRLRVDSSLTMAAYNTPPNTSFVNEGRIYYDRPSNKFKVSENGGAFVDLISGAGLSPWIQGSGIVTQANLTDKVGIGTNTPNASLDIKNNAASLDGLALDINNVSNGSNGLQLRHFGVGNAAYIEVNNTGSSAKAIEASTNGIGAAIGATNLGSGSAGIFTISNATNTAAALYVSTNGTGNAIYAANNSSTAVTADFANSSGDVVRAISSGGGRALIASSNSNGTGAVDITNTGTGAALVAYKNSGTTGGNVANFANNSNTNGADVLRAHNTGTAAAIHASNNAVDPASALSLWVENGHVKATQATAAVVTTVTATGGLSATGVTLTLGTCNDVKGSLSAVCTTTGMINPGGQVTFRVSFNKSYSVNPTVVVTPNTDPGQMSYYISTINTGFFNVTFKNNTAANLSGPSFTFGFNYIVIE
ncbi:MAG: hypothetical protein IPL10_20735 [Bacteroidetes bacterium]|nr:hypothetical protein [Bacteroidota bacterium]